MRDDRMLRRRHARRGLLATMVLAGTLAAPAAAREGPAEPDAAGAVDAYFAARDWVTTFSNLPDLDDPESDLRIEGASGVCVILRHRGRAHAPVQRLHKLLTHARRRDGDVTAFHRRHQRRARALRLLRPCLDGGGRAQQRSVHRHLHGGGDWPGLRGAAAGRGVRQVTA